MAHKNTITHVEDPGGVGLSPALRTGTYGLVIAGIVLLAVSLIFYGELATLRVWESVLLAYCYFLFLGLGGIVFTAIQYAASARWSIVVRRISEGMGAYIGVSAFLFLIVAVGGWNTLYDVESAHRMALHNNRTVHIYDGLKQLWLSQAGVIIKGAIFYIVWFLLAQKIRGNSLRQDQTKDKAIYRRNLIMSIAFLIVFAYTFSLHVVDMLMALEPKWYSTMFGVYCFAGLLLSTYCAITLITLAMRRRQKVGQAITRRHMYDLGTWIMAFSCFMMYIGFSQFMLIWYANLPEETFYLIFRSENGWQNIFAILPLLKWIIPFAVLMPQGFRAHPQVQIFVCLCVLAGQWLDLYWIIYPVFHVSPVMPGLPEFGAFLAFLGIFGVTLDRVYAKHSVLPMGDPYLTMSVNGSYL